MNAAGNQSCRVTLVGDVSDEIKRLAKEAASLGKKQAYLEAWLAIEKRLSSDPTQFGECRFRLLKGDLLCHIGAIQPVAVRFAVHEKSRNVFVLKVFLLGR
jgi:hypothetical protein